MIDKLFNKRFSVDDIRKYNYVLKEKRKNIKEKITHCLICNNKLDKTCNSHSIPQVILKGISTNGKIYTGDYLRVRDLFNKKRNQYYKSKGIKEVGVFRLICSKCDNEIFQVYENTVFFESNQLSNKHMHRIAMKSHLYFYYKKYTELNANLQSCYNQLEDKKISIRKRNETISVILYTLNMMKELKGYRKIIRLYKNSINSHYNFEVIINKTLEFNTEFAFSLPLMIKNDLEGNLIHNLKDFSRVNKDEGRMYLTVFPYKNKTRVILFYRDKFNSKYGKFNKQVKNLDMKTLEEVLTRMILINQDAFYMSEKYKNIFESNKKLMDVLKCTDVDVVLSEKFHDFSYKPSNMFDLVNKQRS